MIQVIEAARVIPEHLSDSRIQCFLVQVCPAYHPLICSNGLNYSGMVLCSEPVGDQIAEVISHLWWYEASEDGDKADSQTAIDHLLEIDWHEFTANRY
jgi:hypothetical protein